MTKILGALVVGLAVAVSANVATAYVAVVATAIPVTTTVIEDKAQLGDVLRAAIRDVLNHAIGFTPTVVTLEKASVIGDRLYILLFIADEDGESTIEALSTGRPPESTPSDKDRSGAPGRSDGVLTPRNTPSNPARTLAPSL